MRDLQHKSLKIGLVGCGNVGMSAMFAIANRFLVNEIILIDLNKEVSHGHSIDFNDGFGFCDMDINTKIGTYDDLKETDIIFITAGRPQKPNETRLDMIADNAKIIKTVATQIKNAGFHGITIISSNPCDVLSKVYLEITKFPENKVLSSGTALETSRMKVILGEQFNAPSSKIDITILGEHGDSCVSIFSNAKIDGQNLTTLAKEKNIDLNKLHEMMFKRVYDIIEKKGATYYGIGAQVAQIVDAIVNDSKKIIPVGAHLDGQYGLKGIYFGTPCVIGRNGIEKILESEYDDSEAEKIAKSAKVLQNAIDSAFSAIK